MTKSNYEVKDNKIFVNIDKISEKEMKKVKKYISLGYKLVEVKEEKAKRINKDYVLNVYFKDNQEGKDEYNTRKGIKALQWFKETYPKEVKEYEDIKKKVIKVAPKIEENYKKYLEKTIKDNKGNIKEERQSIEEYIRCYYWNKVFSI